MRIRAHMLVAFLLMVAAGGAAEFSIDIGDTGQITVSRTGLILTPSGGLRENNTYGVLISADALKDSGDPFFAGILSTSTWSYCLAGLSLWSIEARPGALSCPNRNRVSFTSSLTSTTHECWDVSIHAC